MPKRGLRLPSFAKVSCEDAASLRAEVAASRTAATAAIERAAAGATTASVEIKALTVACDEARRHATEQTALAARLGGELEAVRRQADAYHALVSKRKAARETPTARGSKNHAN